LRGRGDAIVASGAGSGVKSKFKPRIVRRDQTERNKLEREEQARLAARNKGVLSAERAAAKVRGGGVLGRGRGGRGRGDAMGRGELGFRRGGGLATASGPFGVAPVGSGEF
jgi:DNA-directed RNA polymerase III subunit RPC4